MPLPALDELDDYESYRPRTLTRARTWESVAAGARVAQWGYGLSTFGLGLGTWLFSPQFWLEWPGVVHLPSETFFRFESGVYLCYYPTVIALLAGIFLCLMGQAMCGMAPRVGRLIAWAAVLLLLLGLFLQVIQTALPAAVPSQTASSPSFQITRLILRVAALGVSLLAHFLFFIFVKSAAITMEDRDTSRFANLCLVVSSVYFIVTVVLFTLLLIITLPSNSYPPNQPRLETSPLMRDVPGLMRESGPTALIVFYGWNFLGVFVVLLLIALLQQLRVGIQYHLKAPPTVARVRDDREQP